ncbi:MAG: methyltransferase domain-containing protein [Deltaproteobacteria bacterium]|nr:methyltransferase domain-containing protein [Desulfitobacteriaceae bacterium]MDI6855026.1 methyltransferase domain-containing protein [Deltaproteobacteria bacterium]
MGLVQVQPEHYQPIAYDVKSRFPSYWHQIREVLIRKPSRVLEIGTGNGFVSSYLRRVGIEVVSVDIDASLGPDLTASVTSLPFKEGIFDVVIAYQVLEHLPFERFSQCLSEMAEISSRYILISLPDRRPFLSIRAGIYPWIAHEFHLTIPVLFPRKHRFDGEHYWEIGKQGYTLRTILQILQKVGLRIECHYRVPEKPFHHLFMTEKISCER